MGSFFSGSRLTLGSRLPFYSHCYSIGLSSIHYIPGTPSSDLPLSQVLNSDITMICTRCDQYIDVASLRNHRDYHHALKMMEYTTERPPPDTNDLIMRRQHILNRYAEFCDVEHPLDPLLVQRINDAFEYLRSEVENTFDGCRKLRESRDYEQRGFSLGCSAQCVCAVGVCSDGNSRWKTSMQDTRVYQVRNTYKLKY